MKKYMKISLNKRLNAISMAAFIPMFLVMLFLLVSLSGATKAYADITQSVTYANQYAMDFKERMDNSMYLAVIGKKSMEELGDGETTVNGIVTVNPYEYIAELSAACDKLSDMATVDINRNQITRLKNSLKSLERCVSELEEGIKGKATYQENVDYLDENIYMLTSLIQSGIQEYIYVETTNFDNVRAGLDAQNARTFTVCSLISMAAIIVSILLTVNASRSVTRPIQKLCSVTQKVAEGDFTVKTKVENTDEISVLTQSFNDMTEEIGVLVEDIKKKQANLHIAETKLLQAQINPHFLYNTLDTIVWLAEENKKEEVVSMVTALSEFFRTTLSKGRDFITVKEEESHVESYLKIQQFRYQDIMDYEINIDESMYGFVIPKLTLQPLVENALYHGVKNKRGKGMIRITGRLKGGDMIFKVIDDGKGMTEEELGKLQNSLKKDKSDRKEDGFGLSNVNQRIRHYYGEGYGISFESRENEGTTATIILEAKNNQPFV